MAVISNIQRTIASNISSILSLYTLQAFNYIFPLIIIPIVIKHIGVDNYGLIAYSISVIQLSCLVIDYGFNYTATVKSARLDVTDYFSYYITITSNKLVIAIAVLLSIYTLKEVSNSFKFDKEIYAVLVISALGAVFFPGWLLQGCQQFKLLSLSQLATKTLLSILCISYIVFDGNNISIVVFTLTSHLIFSTILLSIFVLYKKPSMMKLMVASTRKFNCIVEFKLATNMFISVLGSMGYNNLIPIILGNTATPTSVAIYTVLQKLTMACQSLINPLSQFMLAKVSSSVELLFKRIQISLYLHILLGLGALIGYSVFGNFTISMLGVPEAPFMAILISALIPLISAVSNVLGIQYLLPRNKDKLLRNITLLSGLFTVCAAKALIDKYGVIGAVSINLLGEALVLTLLALNFINDHWRLKITTR